jgi:hypothetical protein
MDNALACHADRQMGQVGLIRRPAVKARMRFDCGSRDGGRSGRPVQHHFEADEASLRRIRGGVKAVDTLRIDS